jgi:exodeoxyribonuclease V beta subunit
VNLGDVTLEHGLCAVTRRAAEMSLLFATRADSRRPETYVRAVVDLVFDHAGKAYFLDWKSDLLASFEPAAIADHVRDHYAVQLKLYTLGVLRALRISDEAGYQARFGGLLYCFLRGMLAGASGGTHFARPTFAQVASWQEELAALDTRAIVGAKP